jgi:hypothetical protein
LATNCVAVDELALSQLLYLIKAKFETLSRIAVKHGSFVRHILAKFFLASTSTLFLQPEGNIHASRLPPLLHRSGFSMWYRQRRRKRPQSQTQTPPPCTARN